MCPRSVTEFSPGKVLYQHVSIYLHAGMSEGCNPSSGLGVCGGAENLSVGLSEGCNPSPGLKGVWGATFFCLSVCK